MMAALSQGGRPYGTPIRYRISKLSVLESSPARPVVWPRSLGRALCRDNRRQCRGAGPRRHFGGRRRCLLPQSAAALGIAVHITLTVALDVTLAYTWRAVRLQKMRPSPAMADE